MWRWTLVQELIVQTQEKNRQQWTQTNVSDLKHFYNTKIVKKIEIFFLWNFWKSAKSEDGIKVKKNFQKGVFLAKFLFIKNLYFL